MWRRAPVMALLAATLALPVPSARAHPHVFVDGGVDFVLRDGHMLEALDVTWLYDEFETLYVLSAYELSLNRQGTLDEADRQKLIDQRSKWPDDFEGSAHLTTATGPVKLGRPANFDLRMINGRLQAKFTRALETPIDLRQHKVDLAFYEATYFYAFKITRPAHLSDDAETCKATVIPFDPDKEMAALQATLSQLGREETPETENVGALFADRIVLQCV